MPLGRTLRGDHVLENVLQRHRRIGHDEVQDVGHREQDEVRRSDHGDGDGRTDELLRAQMYRLPMTEHGRWSSVNIHA